MKFVKPKELPSDASAIYDKVYQANKDKGEESAAKTAWGAVKKGWKKEGEKWVKKEKQASNNFRGSLTDLSSVGMSDDGNTSVIELLRVGTWDHPYYGEFSITPDRIQKFIKNFKDKVRKHDLPIDREHRTDEGAVGWIKDVFASEDGNRMLGLTEWTEDGKEDIKKKKYRFFSPEFSDEYRDDATGQEYEDVLIGGGITNRPFFQELDEIVLSERNQFLTFSELGKKGGDKNMAKLTRDELKEKLKTDPEFKPTAEEADEADVTAVKEEIKTEAEEADKDEDKDKDQDKKDSTDDDQEDEEDAADEGNKTASKKVKSKIFTKDGVKYVQMSEAQLKNLEAQAYQGVKAHKEIESMKMSETVKSFVFNGSNANSALFVPKDGDKLKQFALTLGSNQRKTFFELLNGIQSVNKVFGEKGSSKFIDAEDNDTSNMRYDEVLDKRAKKIMSEDSKNFSEYGKAALEAEKQLKAEGVKSE